MLSRTASHLYWMSRYLERAENLARALDVSRELALLPQGRDLREDIAIPLALTGTRAAFLALHRDITPAGLWQTLGFSLDEPASIACCLKRARENAHAVRGSITADTWETLNTTWLELRARLAAADIDPGAFSDWVKDRSHLFRGIVFGTSLRNDAFNFLRLGTFVERADNTARLLCAHAAVRERGADAYYPLLALLRSVSAIEAYQSCYRDSLTLRRVAELLVLRPDLPRSLKSCLDEISALLPAGGRQVPQVRRRVAELEAMLTWGDIDDVLAEGLPHYLAGFLDELHKLDTGIQHAYLEAL